jgi:hypothetical protein
VRGCHSARQRHHLFGLNLIEDVKHEVIVAGGIDREVGKMPTMVKKNRVNFYCTNAYRIQRCSK